MSVEIFDMETPLNHADSRAQDVLQITELWSQINVLGNRIHKLPPEEIRTLMSGLDYLVIRKPTTTQIIGALSVLDCNRGLAKFDTLAIAPAEQRRGYGRTLTQSAIEHCADSGYKNITTTAMPSSKKLLASLGFEAYQTHDSGNTSMFLKLGS